MDPVFGWVYKYLVWGEGGRDSWAGVGGTQGLGKARMLSVVDSRRPSGDWIQSGCSAWTPGGSDSRLCE